MACVHASPHIICLQMQRISAMNIALLPDIQYHWRFSPILIFFEEFSWATRLLPKQTAKPPSPCQAHPASRLVQVSAEARNAARIFAVKRTPANAPTKAKQRPVRALCVLHAKATTRVAFCLSLALRAAFHCALIGPLLSTCATSWLQRSNGKTMRQQRPRCTDT